MPSKSGRIWEQEFVEIVDQRQCELPPAWATQQATAEFRDEQGKAVLQSGKRRKMADAVIGLIEQAEELVVISSFLLADKDLEDAIEIAAKRGVRIYVLLASEARLEREGSEGEFDRRVKEQHEAMLRRLGGYALFRSAPHFHAKVVVIDPGASAQGVLLTANLTTEALERNEELAVRLNSAEVAEVVGYLRWAMWESAEHELADPRDRFKTTRPLEVVDHPENGLKIVATTSNTNTIREEVLRLINSARSRIVVSSFGWDERHEVVQALCARAREGLDVTVLARMRPVSMPALLKLAEAGANVFGFRWLHAKALWSDAEAALVMSANLQGDGLDKGFELGVRLTGDRAREVGERLVGWCNSAPWRLLHSPRLGDISGAVRIWQKGQLVDHEVKASENVDLGEITALSAAKLEAPCPTRPPTGGDLPQLAHELRCIWKVIAPTLAEKAKELKRSAGKKEQAALSYAPPAFREPSGRLVVAIAAVDELSAADKVVAEVGAEAVVLTRG